MGDSHRLFSVEPPDAEVEPGGKGHPQEIGDLEPGGRRIHLAELQDHPEDQAPQDHQPDQGQAVTVEAEEQNAPDDGKDDGRRRQGRLDRRGLIDFHAVPGQKTRQGADGLRGRNPERVDFPGTFLRA